jgi:amino acid transporter
LPLTRQIFWAMAFTYIAGFLFNIVLAFTMGDRDAILASPMQQPVAQIFYNSLGRAGGIFFTVCAFIILQFVCFTATQALARTVFAFSRDGLVPGSRLWVVIEKRTGIPINAVWFTVFWCIAINLIALGNYTVGWLAFGRCG